MIMDSTIANQPEALYGVCFNVRSPKGYRALLDCWGYAKDPKSISFAGCGVKEGIQDAGLWPAKGVRGEVWYAGGGADTIPEGCVEEQRTVLSMGDYGDWHTQAVTTYLDPTTGIVYCRYADLDWS